MKASAVLFIVSPHFASYYDFAKRSSEATLVLMLILSNPKVFIGGSAALFSLVWLRSALKVGNGE
jgi:hypothetical protein